MIKIAYVNVLIKNIVRETVFVFMEVGAVGATLGYSVGSVGEFNGRFRVECFVYLVPMLINSLWKL